MIAEFVEFVEFIELMLFVALFLSTNQPVNSINSFAISYELSAGAAGAFTGPYKAA
jgi:hypothetical protein